MKSIIRNVRDIDHRARQVLEHVLGQQLHENQKIIIQVETLATDAVEQKESQEVARVTTLPDWCNVFEGLADEQITEVEEVVLQRADLSRLSE